MRQQQKYEIVKISKEFAEPILQGLGLETMEGSSWLVADPLSAYLSSIGYKNKLHQVVHPKTNMPILIMTFKDGSQFVPAGRELSFIDNHAHDFMWID